MNSAANATQTLVLKYSAFVIARLLNFKFCSLRAYLLILQVNAETISVTSGRFGHRSEREHGILSFYRPNYVSCIQNSNIQIAWIHHLHHSYIINRQPLLRRFPYIQDKTSFNTLNKNVKLAKRRNSKTEDTTPVSSDSSETTNAHLPILASARCAWTPKIR